eukprot:7587671-Prorocentrum_lima.AAC.1
MAAVWGKPCFDPMKSNYDCRDCPCHKERMPLASRGNMTYVSACCRVDSDKSATQHCNKRWK